MNLSRNGSDELLKKIGISDDSILNTYFVDDIINDNSELLLILESPHTNEIIHRHPLAGSSGLNTSAIFQKCDYTKHVIYNKCFLPFGCWLKNNKNIKISIINVCNIPLQEKAYSCDSDGIRDKIRNLDIIREFFESKNTKDEYKINGYTGYKYKKSDLNPIVESIEDSFKIKVEEFILKHQSLKTVIVFGIFAQTFFEKTLKAGLEDKGIVCFYEKHPSRSTQINSTDLVGIIGKLGKDGNKKL